MGTSGWGSWWRSGGTGSYAASPKPSVTATEMLYRTMSPRTAPASGAQRAIGRLQNRSKTPVAMSWLSIRPVPSVANTTLRTRIPGRENCRYLCVPPAMAPPKTYVNSSRYMIGCRLSPSRSSMLVLIFSTLRQVSVNVFRSPPSGVSLRAGAGIAAGPPIAVIGCFPPVRGRFPRSRRVAGELDEHLVQAGLAERELRELDAPVIELAEFTHRKASLDEVFIELT